MNILKKLEYLNADFIVWLNKSIPKHRLNNRMLIFADMGIGDLLMFMPTIREVIKLGFEVTFDVRKPVQKEILKKHFPQCSQVKTGKYGWCLMNFQTIRIKKYILEVVKQRIPFRIGHSFGKWNDFFNFPVAFDVNDGNQVINNLRLMTQFNLSENNYSDTIFFETEEINLPFDSYICLAPFSYTDPKKQVNCYESVLSSPDNIILLGSKEEEEACQKIANSDHLRIINLAGKINIFQTAYLLKHANHFFSHEGGLSHIAAAMGTPSTIYYYRSITKEHVMHRTFTHMNYIEQNPTLALARI